jgi:kumamolisin
MRRRKQREEASDVYANQLGRAARQRARPATRSAGPAELAPVIEGVFGLDDRPQAEPHCQLATESEPRVGIAFTPAQVARLYDFPEGTGQGQTIGIIEFGGGFRTEDVQAYFSELGIPVPSVSAVSVDGGQNAPTGDPRSADAEVMLDIEAAGAVAPGANIVVYFAPNSSKGFLDAVTSAVHDTVNRPSVISISWGAAEQNGPARPWTRWTTPSRTPGC